MSAVYNVCFDSACIQPACAPFVADTLAHAQTSAQQISTILQRTVYLAGVGVAGPYTAYTPGASGSALGSQATGISF